ncbi:hypothetical protein [Paenibacillus wulumuqiensis]|uniref:hypothetical protein n=1 Tax=Paenibacillus wulumuqiensis TaxID=1567107 RepID=UPI000B2B47B9|nr:hypothetical protein [Paenibacillus wulumuqiensis]
MPTYRCLKSKIVVTSVEQVREFPSLDWARQYALRELVPHEINFVIRDDDTGELFMDVRFATHTNNP